MRFGHRSCSSLGEVGCRAAQGRTRVAVSMASAESAGSWTNSVPVESTCRVSPVQPCPRHRRVSTVAVALRAAYRWSAVTVSGPRLLVDGDESQAPRAKAMAFAPLSHQWLIGCPPRRGGSATMLRIAGSRCSQTHWPNVAVSRLAAQVRARVFPLRVRRRPHGVPARTTEREARQNRGIAVRLRQHPDVSQPEGVAVPVAQAALVLGVVVLQKDDRLVGEGISPHAASEKRFPAVPFGLSWQELAVHMPELVRPPRRSELGDVGARPRSCNPHRNSRADASASPAPPTTSR